MPTPGKDPVLKLRAGEVVEVRNRADILATLDAEGKLDALPFMPEMLQYCGARFTVYKRADKACDTVGRTGSRRMRDTVHLDGLRCDGTAHGGCQASCLLYWKEAWLKRVDRGTSVAGTSLRPLGADHTDGSAGPCAPCSEAALCAATRKGHQPTEPAEEVYVCQATELPKATSYLAWWDIRQYVRDLASGNVGLRELARTALISGFNILMRR